MSTVREQIVDAAADLFHRRGYGRTSLADIAQAAGLQKGNLSYHFKSKAAILDAVALHWYRHYVEPIQAQQGWPDPCAAVERLLAMVEGSADQLALHGCPVGGLAVDALRGEDDRSGAARANLHTLQGWLRLQLERRVPPAVAADAAERVLVGLQGAAVMAQVNGDAALVVREVDHLRGWLDSLPGWRDGGTACKERA